MGRTYKSPASAKAAQRAKLKRDAVKAAGGEAYAALLERERANRAEYRRNCRPKIREYERSYTKRGEIWRTWICARARARGRKKGLESTITPDDLDWPTHCPILGIELDYPARTCERKTDPVKPNWPSLDRRDPTKGYVPGNVFVLSFRANNLKNNGSVEEFEALVRYLRGCAVGVR